MAAWATQRSDVRAVALVGSWARDQGRPESDVDLVVLTAAGEEYVSTEAWAHALGAVSVLWTRRWGVVTERRLAMPSGLEVDVGIASPSWAETEPFDDGTAAVVRDGLRILHDPDGLLSRLSLALRCP